MGNVMAYVSVPKDLTKVKNKVAFNLTKRQILCFGIAAGIGLPFYFLTRNLIGNSNAVMGMVVLMVPAFLFAMCMKRKTCMRSRKGGRRLWTGRRKRRNRLPERNRRHPPGAGTLAGTWMRGMPLTAGKPGIHPEPGKQT